MDNTSTRSSPVPSRANSRRAASASAATSCTPSITGGSRRSSATLPTSNKRAAGETRWRTHSCSKRSWSSSTCCRCASARLRRLQARLLAPRYQEFTELLEQMRGRIELGLKAFWYEGAAVAEVARENETIRRMRDALNGRSPTETYSERIRLGEGVEHAVAQKRTRDEEMILARIRPLVHKTRTNKIVSDRMVVNAAFLVDRQNGLQLDDAVRRLNDEFNDRLMFKYFGPVPPYNFVNIVVNWEG